MAICKTNVKREMRSEVREVGQYRNIVVILSPSTGEIGLRPKGLKRVEWISAAGVWNLAVQKRVEKERRTKKAIKKAVTG